MPKLRKWVTVNVVGKQFGINLLLGLVVSWESRLRVRDGQTTIDSTLEGTEDAGACGGACQPSVENALEGTGTLVVLGLDLEELAIGLNTALVLVGKTKLGEQTAC